MVFLIVLSIFLAGAAWSDVKYRRVYNYWLLLGLGCLIYFKGAGSLREVSLLLLPGFVLFCFGWIGAGDAKLIAMIGGYLGITQAVAAIGLGFLLGAVLSLFKLVQMKCLFIRIRYFFAYFRQIVQTKMIVPYPVVEQEYTIPLAACFAVGTWLSLLYDHFR